MELDEYYRARKTLEDLLRRDLHGPVAEDEVITDTWPDEYYICGILFPRGITVRAEETERDEIDGEGDGYEVPIDLCYSNCPSSMAISFTVRPGVEKLAGDAGFAWYVPEEPTDGEPMRRSRKAWRRRAKLVPFEIDLEAGGPRRTTIPLHPGLELRIYLRKTYPDGARALTVAMVNTDERATDRDTNCARTFFQPRVVIRGVGGAQEPFMERKPRTEPDRDPEVLTLEMLYRHAPTFAVGHGCSAGWEAGGDYASEVYTEFIPAFETRQMEPARHVRPEILAFRFLGGAPADRVCAGLEEMARSYEEWIVGQEGVVGGLPEQYREVARTNMVNCRESLQRIRAGIGLLATDDLVRQAFQLMNLAMRLQAGQRGGGADDADRSGWYPFQLAFILQEIGSIARNDDPYRDVVDLLWFPTGGGKTEAYLGLAAFTIFLRRLRAVREGRSGVGVTVIMRYTLRLLTLQQFERAAALICACELVRRENPELLGDAEIAAGLWVGGGLTPNHRAEAREALEKIREDGHSPSEDEANPCQVLACPWCKTGIGPRDYSVLPGRMAVACPEVGCPFHEGLPLYLIDEDIYEYVPALVVGTVDKFARMTWQPEVGSLFGLGTDRRPPELIIQDELHLISGPLGTIAGLYETAVDEFCRSNGCSTKIISSTATIRNAAIQIRSLYGRDCRQFPPQGLDIRDSYFAREAPAEDRPTRRYLGVLVPSASGKTRLVRVYSILLAGVRYLAESGFPEEVVDSFWTLVGYFNALKDLGAALYNVVDDVQGRLKYLYETKFAEYFPAGKRPPAFLHYDELTSRKRSSEIGEVLKKLETPYPAEGVYDLILASSMLSVGVDIGRLGVMMVQGQPKSNSEYIQATSRVGRRTPGLIVAMYDASRSRDRSHYEQFRAYHASLYKYVEAASLTPFAERARDRALHAVLISLCRHLVAGLRENGDAGRVGVFRAQVREMIDRIVERAERIDPTEAAETRRDLENILRHWESMASSTLVYQKFGDRQDQSPLLTGRFDGEGNALPTLNSMRDVDVECSVYMEG